MADFPCQPFSIAGVSKKKSLDRAHGFLCETQGTLFFDVARILKAKRPLMFMLENVKNLLRHDRGNTFRVIRETPENLNYNISNEIADAWMAMDRRKWRREELIVAFNLYCRTPFGRLHKSNPDIINLSEKLGRTPSALAMKLVNFASLDPVHTIRNVKGLGNTSKEDRNIWNEFHLNWEKLSIESQYIFENIDYLKENNNIENIYEKQFSNTEITRPVKVRMVQGFFRDTVLSSYDIKCAICHLNLPELLNASHIIPWRICVEKRADPTNGIALCALHDRAFDRGLISFNETCDVILSKRIKTSRPVSTILQIGLLDIEGVKLSLPSRFQPDKDALQFHREHIFQL